MVLAPFVMTRWESNPVVETRFVDDFSSKHLVQLQGISMDFSLPSLTAGYELRSAWIDDCIVHPTLLITFILTYDIYVWNIIIF